MEILRKGTVSAYLWAICSVSGRMPQRFRNDRINTHSRNFLADFVVLLTVGALFEFLLGSHAACNNR